MANLWRLSVECAYELRKENDELMDEKLNFEGRMENAARERSGIGEARGQCVRFLEETGYRWRGLRAVWLEGRNQGT